MSDPVVEGMQQQHDEDLPPREEVTDPPREEEGENGHAPHTGEAPDEKTHRDDEKEDRDHPPRRDDEDQDRDRPRERVSEDERRRTRTILIRNMAMETSPGELRRIFSKYGEIKDVYIPLDVYRRVPRGFGFVEFAEEKDAREAMADMTGRRIDGKEVEIVYGNARRKTKDEMRNSERNREQNRWGGGGSYDRRDRYYGDRGGGGGYGRDSRGGGGYGSGRRGYTDDFDETDRLRNQYKYYDADRDRDDRDRGRERERSRDRYDRYDRRDDDRRRDDRYDRDRRERDDRMNGYRD
ncbi:unnamed protein product [Vitrella brassicaformis CCMP3155]|uniref:RRM domain-containing protein n=1 Tax=Vitrella brassicaformis (strain CCMP3155) TaxID=1169540 RepID=A0A0G4G2A7_VITBC|nr:unnamed protein product [Vitrella brassicaformis CCMP3155]|mmetsp:Transcript_23485/g.67473  ORF Transcript_23485/g.67473 Transcript_23485/m.67473 type:complete len:295 (-) Transcript_23485:35-919(-)|eukprot:CEM21963.1 unnamed protein product [Vitrella brassicaformis CCMP3155]